MNVHGVVQGIGHIVRKGLRMMWPVVGVGALATMLAVGVFATPPSASAAPPTALSQCNGVFNAAAADVECHVVIANTLDLVNGTESAVATVTICIGAPAAAICGVPTVSNYDSLITSVTQCNSSGNAGGSTIICDVAVTNTIVGGTTPTPATVNQCIGSGTGGGGDTLLCGPLQNTTNATITQCNGSGNGGGAPNRVECSFGASTETPALRVLVDQCNGSGNGGGATVTCATSETNLVTLAVPPGGGTTTTGGTTTGGTTGTGTTGTSGGGATTGDTTTGVSTQAVTTGTTAGQTGRTTASTTGGGLAATGAAIGSPLLFGLLALLIGASLALAAASRRAARR